MPAINMSSIMSKVGAYSRSVDGKLRMKDCIEKYQRSGKTTTGTGDKLINEDMMLEAASKMITILRDTAREYNLPESVMRHFGSLGCSSPIRMPDGSTYIYIYFDDGFDGGLHRDSLQPNKYGGVDNIIAVLNNGYGKHESMAKVWGVWHDVRVHALTERTGLHFIQQAVSDFNGNYGYEYNVTAEVGEAYL